MSPEAWLREWPNPGDEDDTSFYSALRRAAQLGSLPRVVYLPPDEFAVHWPSLGKHGQCTWYGVEVRPAAEFTTEREEGATEAAPNP